MKISEAMEKAGTPPKNEEELNRWAEGTDRFLCRDDVECPGKLRMFVRGILRGWTKGFERDDYPKNLAYLAWSIVIGCVKEYENK